VKAVIKAAIQRRTAMKSSIRNFAFVALAALALAGTPYRASATTTPIPPVSFACKGTHIPEVVIALDLTLSVLPLL